MSDEREALAAALRAISDPQSIRVLHKAIIVDQDAGEIGVKMPGDGAPSETAKPVPIWFGLPCFSAEFKPASAPEVSIGFHAGKENGAFAALFPYSSSRTLPIVHLSFGGGTRPIARVNDTVSLGSIRYTNTPPLPGPPPIPTGYIIERVLANGTVVPIGAVVGPVSVVPSPLTISLDGRITSGREEFLA